MLRAHCVFLIQPTYGSGARKKPWAGRVHGRGHLSPRSANTAPSDYYLFADLKKMLQGKRFYSNEEVITETYAYFKANDKSFYRVGHIKFLT